MTPTELPRSANDRWVRLTTLGGVFSGQALWEQPRYNGADGISDIEGKVARVSDERVGKRTSFNSPSTLLTITDHESLITDPAACSADSPWRITVTIPLGTPSVGQDQSHSIQHRRRPGMVATLARAAGSISNDPAKAWCGRNLAP